MAERGLGKGLGALLGENAVLQANEAGNTLPIERVEPNAAQPRRLFDEKALLELSESIKEHGLIQPITVRRLESGYYQIIAGERRWRAARMAGLKEVPVMILEADDLKAMEMALIENLQREDLNPIEEAEGYKTLIERYGLTQEETARRIGRSRPVVSNSLRLLSLPAPIIDFLEQGTLSEGHARVILSIKEPELQELAAAKVIEADMSVRQTEALVRRLTAGKKTPPVPEPLAVDYIAEAAKQIGQKLGRRVSIISGRKKGRLEIEYYGDEDLQALLTALETLSVTGAGEAGT